MEKEKIVFLEGKRVILRPLDKEKDLGKTLKWINDPEARQYWGVSLPITKKQQEEWLDFDKEVKDTIRLAIETKEGKFIGIIELKKIDFHSSTAEAGIYIGEKEYWSKGYGACASIVLLNYVFNELNLRKIRARAFAFNERSINLQKKFGFRIEGILKREKFINGKYVDIILFALFKKDWLKTRKNSND